LILSGRILHPQSSSLFTPSSAFKIPVQSERMMLKNNACRKPSTLNPSTSFSAKMIMTALITSRNKPSVTIVIGIVRIVRTGFTMAFKKASTMATINAER
jgi:hypothetical protein